jgi:hypothetical protein
VFKPRKHAQQRRLAGTRRADDGEEFTFRHVEVDAVDGVETAERFSESRAREWWAARSSPV